MPQLFPDGPQGGELFYRNGKSVVSVSVETETTFKSGKPKALSEGEYCFWSVGSILLPMWDIHPEGKRFFMMKPTKASDNAPESVTPRKINIVVNWFEELKERVPTD